MANSDRTRKMLTRTALVTSTTIATLVGAQSLVMLDGSQFSADAAPADAGVTLPAADTSLNQPQVAVAQPVIQNAPKLQIVHAAPNITILREPGQQTGVTTNRASSVIQPPNPVALSTPVPVIIQPPPQIIIQQQSQGGHSSSPRRSSSRSSR